MTVSYELADSIAHFTLDDGKRNALGFDTFAALNDALDRAAADRKVVVIAGRPDVFSAGFDLHVLRAGGPDVMRLVLAGFELASRLYAFPAPVVIACTGHAIAMGAFMMLAGDYRLGAAGDYKIGANEVAIGLLLPHFAVELCRQRLAPTHFHRAVELAELYAPDEAVDAGFLDHVVPARDLPSEAIALAKRLSALDYATHAATKQRARAPGVEALAEALASDRQGSGLG